jgi:hypothetical protein
LSSCATVSLVHIGKQQNMIFLRIFGIALLIWGWVPVFNPAVRVFYRRSHVPVSRMGKALDAVGKTAFCLAAFGVRPLLCAGAAAACVAAEMWVKKQDFRQYEKQTGRWVFRPTDQRPTWVAALALDAAFLSLFLVALIRDYFSSPVSQDQRILHYMSLGCVAFFSIAGALLLWDRPRQDAPKQ